MIQFKIGTLDLTNYVSAFGITRSDIISNNSFPDVNGNQIEKILSIKTTLKVSLSKLSGATAGQVMDALYGGAVSITATAPTDLSGSYKRDGDVNVSSGWVNKSDYEGAVEWKIDFSVSKVDSGSSGSDGL